MKERVFSEVGSVEAELLKAEFEGFLGSVGIEGVRLFRMYDISGLRREDLLNALPHVFSNLHDGSFDSFGAGFVFAVKYLPGVFDQEAVNVARSLALFSSDAVVVETAKIYVITGNIDEESKQKILNYVINPVDEVRFSLDGDYDSLGMSEADKELVRSYFRTVEKRTPTLTELKVLDTYWSDHCRHTTFLTEITDVRINDSYIKEAFDKYLLEREYVYGADLAKKPICLMDLATIYAKSMLKSGGLTDLELSEEQNAASFEVKAIEDGKETEWLVMFKNETHNHPTEIEPFGGAATCLGGAIRDVLAGRAFVYQAMRLTGAADPRTPLGETLPGKLPQRKLAKTAALGYSSYGNQVGVPSGLVTEIYHPGYAAKRMEAGALVGAVKKNHVRRESPAPGDVVILVGGRTGRDGVGGATGSSVGHTSASALSSGAEVQRGDPYIERGITRLFRNPQASALIKKCNDFGAGGVSVAVGELADGILIDLNKVPLKYEGLSATEVALSESQERMAVVVEAASADEFIFLAGEENLEAAIIAEVTDNKRVTMTWNGEVVVDISREFLDSSGARRRTAVVVDSPVISSPASDNGDCKSKWLKNLSALNVCSQRGLHEIFDSTVGAGTILAPYGGKNQLTPAQAMAAKLPSLGEIDTCTIMAHGFDADLSSVSPYHGAAAAVVASVAKIAAAGGTVDRAKLSFQEFFGSPMDDPARYGIVFAALLGAYSAQSALKIPSVGGKDSMSGTFKFDNTILDVPPTLVSFAIAAEKHENVISPEFKGAGNTIALLPCGTDKHGVVNFDNFRKNIELIRGAAQSKKLLSAYATGKGGAAAALSLMAFGNGIGFALKTEADLFAEDYGGFVLELLTEDGDVGEVIGETTSGRICVNGIEISLDEALDSWTGTLEDVYPSVEIAGAETTGLTRGLNDGALTVRNHGINPKVLIPIFLGTTGEFDLQKAFRQAGAEAEFFVVKDLTAKASEESVKTLASRIAEADIIALPGGDEDGSVYAALILRNPIAAEAIDRFLDRKGLILGIGAGFHTLLRLGLLPFGKITEISKINPNIANSQYGRHISRFAEVRIISDESPWLSGVKTGEIYNLPISYKSGHINVDAQNSKIAAVFEHDGSVEALISADGRILGKLGHSERAGNGLYKNIRGNFDQKLFESAVKYFRGPK